MLSQVEHLLLRLLFFDPLTVNKQQLVETLNSEAIAVHLQLVETLNDFKSALTADTWDAVLVSYTTFDEALSLVELVGQKLPVILICTTQEEADSAYGLATKSIADVVVSDQLKRLSFILRREVGRTSSASQSDTTRTINTTTLLSKSEARFRSVIESFNDLILFVDQYQMIRYANWEALTRNLGFQASDIISKPLDTFLQADEKTVIEEKLLELLHSADSRQTFECQLRHAAGHWETAEITSHRMNDPLGQPTLILHIRIITERKHAAEKIKSLNRTLAVLSDINQAIVRVRDIPALFEEMCKIAIEKGAFRMAWVGLLDPQSKQISLVARAGMSDNYLAKLSVAIADYQSGNGPTAHAISTKKYVICNDLANDPQFLFWREDALALGYRGLVALPLIINNEVRGTFNLYADEPNFFDDAEMRLLDEMAGDISFAMEFAEREIHRKRAEAALLESEGRYHRILDDLLEGAEIIGFDWGYLYVNDASASHGRMAKEALLRGNVLSLYPGIEQSEMFAHLRVCMEDRIPQHFENEFTFPDGTKTWFELSVQPIKEGIFILSLDITERKRSERVLQRYAKRMEVLHEIDTGIINATSTEEIVETALKYIRELIPCKRTSIILFDLPMNEGIVFADHTDQPHTLGKSFRAPLPANWEVGFGTNTSRIIDDLRLAQPQTPIYQTLVKDGFLSGIQALLMVQGQRIGLLGLNADTPNFFTSEHLEIASEIANQLAIALRQMQLSDVLTHHAAEMEQKNVDLTLAEIQLQRYARRMEILHEIDNGLIQGTSIPALIQVTLKHLRQLIPCQQANVTMIYSKTNEGQIFAHDLNRDSFFVEGARFALPDDVYEGYDARHLRIFNDIRPLQESSARAKQLVGEGMRSLLSAMLTDHSRPMGSLVLVSDTLNFFNAEYQEIASEVASQLAIAIRQLQLSTELHESETRYRRVVEDQTDLICRYKADFTLTFVNQAYANAHGKSSEELIGVNFFDLMPEDERDASLGYLASLSPANPVATTEHRLLLPDGSECWMQWTDRALIDENGNITECQGVGRDITERKKAEELLRKSEARQRAMLTAIPDIMFRYDADGTFLEYHAPDEKLLAESPETFLGKTAHDVLPSELAEAVLKRVKQVIATKEPILMEYELAVQSGTREFESRMVPVAENEVLAIVRDVTERKLAERELQALYNATSYLFKADSLLSLGRQIVTTVVREFEHADCGIMLLDKSKNNILRLARTGHLDIQPVTSLNLNGQGLVPLAMRTGDIVYASDVIQNKNYIVGDTSTQSELVIPLKTANGIIGALDMQHTQKNGFSERDRRILTAYAERAAPAIETMQLYEELNRHAADLEWRVTQRTVELNYAKERAEAILNHSADGIILLDTNMIIEQTNLAFNEIFAAGDDAYFQQPFMELLEEAERERIKAIFQSSNIEQKGQRLETRARRKDGAIFDAELAIGFIKKKGLVCIIRDVTERKQAEKAIAEERNLLRTLIDALPDYIYVKDINHKTLLSNIARTRLFGLTAPEETIGKDDYAFIPADMVAQFHADEDRLFQTLEPIIDKEEHTIGVSKKFIWATTTKVPLHNLNGELIGLVGVTRDISDRKQREQQLRFDAGIQASISDAVIATDLQVRVQSWNKAAEIIYGWNAVETLGKSVTNILQSQFESGDDRVKIVGVLLEEGHWQGEFTQLRKDGTKVYIQSSTTMFKDENGVALGIVSVNRDVTESRKAQETLRLSEERYRLLAENITDIISRISPEDIYIDVSSSSKAVLGYAPEEMIGKYKSEFIHPDDVDIVFQKRQESLKRRIASTLTYRFRHRDGHYIWLEVARKFILSEGTNTVKETVTSSRDITVRKRAEEALKNALEKEKELSELKSRFVSMASHEFRTPLATILATSETLSAYRSKLGENQIQDKLNKISDQVLYLKSIIEDTLQIAHLQDPKARFEPVELDLDAVCQSVIDEFESRPEVKQQFIYSCDDTLQHVRVDGKLIRQIINNLLSNSVKYSAPDTIIHITLERIDSALVLKVQDHGIGIPEADLKHLFEPFHRAANVGAISGTGLGLVIAKESVELHGGLMSVETKVDVGTTFTIMIPLQ